MKKEDFIKILQDQLPDNAEVKGYYCLVHYHEKDDLEMGGVAEMASVSSDTLGAMFTKSFSGNKAIKQVAKVALNAADHIPGPEHNN